MRSELLTLWEKQGNRDNVYVGAEAGKIIDGQILITMPEIPPLSKIIYFPKGTYLVRDTLTYTLGNLGAPQLPGYTCELCRNIHIVGEDKNNTVIKLADNSKGFEKGCEKPVICFNKLSVPGKETTNCAQMNTLEDITIDCGSGNDGAIGVLYASSNCGRIENVTVKTESGYCGIDFDTSSEAVVTSVTVSGFDYGIRTGQTSPLALDEINLSDNKTAGILTKDGNMILRRTNFGKLCAFEFLKGVKGRYYVDKEVTATGDTCGNHIFVEKSNPCVVTEPFPKNKRSENPDEWAVVDDFGAVGDGVTDSTVAVQNAFNSGKSVIVFGEGDYLINKTIKIPASVKTIDFMYGSIVPGYSLIVGEMNAFFDICASSDEMLFAEHFMARNEKTSGFFRIFRHSAKRNVAIKDFCVSAALYFNTVGGSKVYFDNCFTHTNHYAQDACLPREGYTPVFCKMIPVEVHNQKVFAKNLNIERGETELLNDNSEITVDGFKVEGPGMLVCGINGGKTRLNLFNAAWWGNKLEDNSLFKLRNSSLDVTGGIVFCYNTDKKYQTALDIENGEFKKSRTIDECSEKIMSADELGRDNGVLVKNITVKL